MTGLNHVIRRGAVYVWRRRITSRASCKTERYLQVSLRTTRFSTAKTLANIANLAFATCMLDMEHGRITPAEAQSFLARLVADELTRIEEERYFEPPASSPAEWRTRYLIERSRAVATRLVASRGMGAALFPEDRAELAPEGFSDADLAMVEREIAQVRDRCSEQSFVTETCEQASSVLGRGPNSDADVRALVAVRVAAEAEALSRTDRRKTLAPYVALQAVAASVVPVEPPQARKQRETATAGQEGRKRRYSTGMQDILVDYLTECERVSADKDRKQAEKDLRQKRGILAQFLEAVEVTELTALRQDDISHYFDVWAALPKNHGKSPADRARSLDEILERAEGLSPEQVGLSANTVNRNITVLNGFVKFARKRGLHPGEAFELSDYRMKSDDDERQARLAFTEEDCPASPHIRFGGDVAARRVGTCPARKSSRMAFIGGR